MINLLKQRFAKLKSFNLPIYGIQNTNLRDYTTTEKDMKRGVSRMPPSQLRLHEEDIMKQGNSLKVDNSGEE